MKNLLLLKIISGCIIFFTSNNAYSDYPSRRVTLEDFTNPLTEGISYVLASDGNGFIVSYKTLSSNPFVLWRCDSIFQPIWCKRFDQEVTYASAMLDTILSSAYGGFYSISNPDGNFILVVTIDSSWTINNIHSRKKLLSFTKFDNAGNYLWTRVNEFDSLINLEISMPVITNDGSIFIYDQNIISKYDSLGNFNWSKSYSNAYEISINKIAATPGNEVVILGSDSLDAYLFKIDLNGNIIFNQKFTTTTHLSGFDIDALLDNSLLVSLNTTAIHIGGILIHCDQAGNILQSKLCSDSILGGNNLNLLPITDDSILCFVNIRQYVLLDSSFNARSNVQTYYYSGGGNSSSHELPYLPSVQNGKLYDFYEEYWEDTWIGMYVNHSRLRELQINGQECTGLQSYYHQPSSYQLSVSQSLLSDTSYFGPSSSYNSSIPNDTVASFVNTNSCYVSTGYEVSTSIDFTAFPNPTRGMISVKSNEPFYKETTLAIYDNIGRVVCQRSFSNIYHEQIDLSKFAKGLYLLKITDGNKMGYCKIIVE